MVPEPPPFLFESTAGQRPARLLVVDDDPVNRQIVCSIFSEDHAVEAVGSAAEALAICHSWSPDLVLLDVLMPELDGLEACRLLKSDPATQDIPVIFITGQDSPQEETEALGAGAVDFITKPVNPAVVRARVRTHLTLKAQSDLLRAMAFMDGLTGLANRRRFDDCLETEWRRARRNSTPVTLLMADIDWFKHYNDSHGHPEGDACLKRIARTLKATLKRPQDLAARYGGEEFACVLPETDLGGGRRVAASLLEAIQDLHIPHEGVPLNQVTLSIGVATMVPQGIQEPSLLLEAADANLYQAKNQGRNQAYG